MLGGTEMRPHRRRRRLNHWKWRCDRGIYHLSWRRSSPVMVRSWSRSAKRPQADRPSTLVLLGLHGYNVTARTWRGLKLRAADRLWMDVGEKGQPIWQLSLLR